jgi:membrane-associated phospholipid phosphatase
LTETVSHGKPAGMLLWVGIVLIGVGLCCLSIDRRAAHRFYDRIGGRFYRFLQKTTHLAKAAHWLAFAGLTFALAWGWRRHVGENAWVGQAQDYAAAFILALGLGTLIAHTLKLLLGRRRPRDEIEMKLYGFLPFAFDLKFNSFPSGHALTIFLVAATATSLFPLGAPLWFAVALWLGLTRAFLTAHFLSDVFVGAGIGLISAHIVFCGLYPHLALGWF